MVKLKRFAAKGHQGPHLEINEDDYDVDLLNNLYMILDGFGGSGIGDKYASMVKEKIKSFYVALGSDPDSTMPHYFSSKYLIEGNALINAMYDAHEAVMEENKQLEMSDRGGASVIAAAIAENIITFSAVGNCIAYLYRRGSLGKIIIPDTLKSISKDNFLNHLYTSPTSGIGLFEDLHLQTREIRACKDDLVILMTDGVYSRVNYDELKFVIENHELDFPGKIDELFNLSNSRGNLDNQTMMFLQF